MFHYHANCASDAMPFLCLVPTVPSLCLLCNCCACRAQLHGRHCSATAFYLCPSGCRYPPVNTTIFYPVYCFLSACTETSLKDASQPLQLPLFDMNKLSLYLSHILSQILCLRQNDLTKGTWGGWEASLREVLAHTERNTIDRVKCSCIFWGVSMTRRHDIPRL